MYKAEALLYKVLQILLYIVIFCWCIILWGWIIWWIGRKLICKYFNVNLCFLTSADDFIASEIFLLVIPWTLILFIPIFLIIRKVIKKVGF
jgi:hypothetical protein